MHDYEESALAAIDAVFQRQILYTSAVATDTPVLAVFSDMAADAFQGLGATARQVTYEIPQSALQQRPLKGDILIDGDATWRVIEVMPRDDIGRWILSVERP